MPTIALLSWPLIAVIIAAKLPRVQALITLVLLPYLYLPEAFSVPLPGLPDLDKTSIISFSLILAFAVTSLKPEDVIATPAEGDSPLLKNLLIGCVVLLLLSVVMTVLANREPLVFERRFIPGLKLWDAVSLLSAVIVLVVPFYFAQRFLTSPQTHLMFLYALVLAGLAYSLLMLVETRFSPQLHNWVYGYHQHSFLQHVRDGFRPKVFLRHGIHVGFFTFTAMFAALCLWRVQKDPKWAFSALWLGFILLISRNLGALMIAFMALGMAFFLSVKLKRIAIGLICVLILGYPMIRDSPVSPANITLSIAERISEERAGTFAFRLRHEDSLLAKAKQKPLTGWGGWGRNREYNAQGRDLSVTDGLWIQRFGLSGWPGYLGFFGLLCLPLLFLARRRDWDNLPIETVGLAIIMTGNLIYIIPNNVMSPLAWTMSGALVGMLSKGMSENQRVDTVTSEDAPQGRYSRFGPTT